MVSNKLLGVLLLLLCIAAFPVHAQQATVSGTITDAQNNEPLPGVNVLVKGTTIGASTDVNGHYELEVPSLQDSLVISFIGFQTQTIPIDGRSEISVGLQPKVFSGEELVVLGYGTQEKKAVTGAISSVGSEALESVHNGATVSTMLAGQISGLSFRQSEGRPGASASISIRNMGTPLYVIDGVVKDEGQFNNLSSYDIENITVLKDAAAAIYGSRAANGVVVVTTKSGSLNSPTKINVNTYVGWQNLTKYPNNVLTSGYRWKLLAAEAEMNQYGTTSTTKEELQKWKKGTEYGYQSFDWPSFIFRENSPQTSVNISASGGTESTNYYISLTRLNQDAVFKQYNFNRTNLQSNVATRVGDFKFGIRINGRIEQRVNPGVPGVDDYWQPLFSSLRNRPTSHPYANNNPEYLNDIGHNQTNAGLWNYETSGKMTDTWRVLQTNFNVEYNFPVEGLSAKASYSYYYSNQYMTNHEYTYEAYTYDPETDTYNVTGGSSNPWQEREQEFITEGVMQGQLNYDNTFGKHTVGGLLLTEWYERRTRRNWLHDVPPVNELDIIRFNSIDQYDDSDDPEARIGFVGRFTYNYDEKYYVVVSGRRDASYLFPPDKRWGFFPSASVGWRISEEPFFKALVGENSILTNLKLRASYGKLGDDDIEDYLNIDDFSFSYIPGYNYAEGTIIFDGEAINTSAARGVPITNISWFTSTMLDVGADFGLWDGKITGSIDYFYRKRTGLLARRYDVLIPSELGYALPYENLNSDAQLGGELMLAYHGSGKDLTYSITANVAYSRHKFLHSYKPRFGNSWDRYRFSGEERWSGIFWGYQVIGQFQSQEQVNNYPVNIDGQGNTTLLPGDFIYKDVNKDGVINGYDERPIGYNSGSEGQPTLYGGLGFTVGWNGFDLVANFSFGSGYSINRTFEARWPFQNGGNLLKAFADRWHREDPFDLNSEWIEGKYPPLRFNTPNHSNYNKNSDWWLINVKYFRLRTLELGYTLPQKWSKKAHVSKARIFINSYNLFSIDNMPVFMDPGVEAENGLQYPQTKFVNVGINLTF